MKQRCEVCPTIADCKHAFGKYWAIKSSMGTGCNHPFAYQRPERRTHIPPPTRKPVQGTML